MPVRRDKPAPPMSLDTYRLLMLSERMEPTGHVCGNCRNPWSKQGREDCKNNRGRAANDRVER